MLQVHKPTSELLEIFRAKQNRDAEPYWNCLVEPTDLEIHDAIHAGILTPWSPGGDSSPAHQGERSWHIGRIAWLAVNWKSDYPVKISSDGKDIAGGHRLYAARFLGIETLETTYL
jgi:hypothetical protein